ncbi:MAG: hypothetical protein IIB56_18145 [Planctomycetes bacterium]|nr:hypothetical protein [Planctomycetota bacterium]
MTNLAPATSIRKVLILGFVLVLVGVVAVLGSAGVANAAAITVMNLHDSGPGSLRQAIANASPGDTIDFAVTGTITLTSGELVIDKDLTINGPGAMNLSISGNHASRVLNIFRGNFAISGVTIQHGRVVFGAGIFNLNGNVSISRSIISGNNATYQAGGILNHNDTATLILTDSLVIGNTARDAAGGILNYRGSMTVTGTTITRNTAGSAGGIRNEVDGAMIINNSTIKDNNAITGHAGGLDNHGIGLTVSGTTISGNTAAIAGGGIHSHENAVLSLSNSTISGNTAGVEGGGLHVHGFAILTNNTFNENAAGVRGGGIYSFHDGWVFMSNMIIANSPSGSDCMGATFASLGHNLDSDGTCNLTEPTDLSHTDPLLGSLRDNGGPSYTHALMPGSPAIDAAKEVDTLETDQRGVHRPQGAAFDIGSFERRSMAP